jgi:hypothetical protein
VQEFHIDSSMRCRSRDRSSAANGYTDIDWGNCARLVSDIETELFEWIQSQRSGGISITMTSIQQQPRVCAHNYNNNCS